MLLAQLVDFYYKQHIYVEEDALRRRDGERAGGAGGELKLTREKARDEEIRTEDEEGGEKKKGCGEERRGESGRREATRAQWEMNIKQW